MRSKLAFMALAIVLCGFMTLLSSCSELKLKAAVEAANTQCPMSLGSTAELTTISYEDDAVIFAFTIDETLINIDMLADNPEAMKALVKTMIASQNGKTKVLLDMMVDADALLCIKFIGRDSHKETSIMLANYELKGLI
jgi:hypothetical protein